MDTARVTTFGTMIAIPQISKRFALKRFLGLSAEEVAENEKLWREENIDDDATLPASAELRSVGITANNMGSDIAGLNSATQPPAPEEPGAEGATPPEAPPAA